MSITNTPSDGDFLSWDGTSLNWAAQGSAPVTSVSGRTGDVTLAKSDVGLDDVNNTADSAKPISAATQTALDAKANSTDLATVATTGSYANLLNKPVIPAAGAIYWLHLVAPRLTAWLLVLMGR